MKTPYSFTLPKELVDKIDAAAEADARSRSSIVRRILQNAFEDDAKLRAVASEHFRKLQGGNT
jgi:metal-responsive CopG/Arc/MetJ family transcriptional regulator